MRTVSAVYWQRALAAHDELATKVPDTTTFPPRHARSPATRQENASHVPPARFSGPEQEGQRHSAQELLCVWAGWVTRVEACRPFKLFAFPS